MARLYEEYIKKIKPNLMKELGLKNIPAWSRNPPRPR